jgi:ferredoxin
MTYVVDERCIKCKTTDCVAVCPVNCFYEGENMLVIHSDECIDCGVCVPECPVDAIKPDTEPGLEKWLELNREYAQKWPNITVKKDMPKDARAYWDETGKFDKLKETTGARRCRYAPSDEGLYQPQSPLLTYRHPWGPRAPFGQRIYHDLAHRTL